MFDSKNKPRVLVEGTDLAGKDTLGERIAKRLGISSLRKLSVVRDNPHQREMDDFDFKTRDRNFFRLIVARAILHDIHHADYAEDMILVSSNALRAASYESAMQMPLRDIFVELLKYSPSMSVTILLQASLEAKRARLLGRPGQSSPMDNMVFTKPEVVATIDMFITSFARTYFQAEMIDTTDLSEGGVEEVALSILELHQQNTDFAQALRVENAQRRSALRAQEKNLQGELADYEQFLIRKKRDR